jgi:hypothetical protein
LNDDSPAGLPNDRVVVTEVWKQFLSQVLPYFRGKGLVFVLDNTPFNDTETLISIGLLIHSRVLPVAWCVMPAKSRWPERQWTIVARLLDQLVPHLQEMHCTLIADRGLGGAPLVQLCCERNFHSLLRLCKEHTCQRKLATGWSQWCAFQDIISKKGQHWYGQALVWQDQPLSTNVSACWQDDEEEAWILISDEPAGPKRVSEYAWRMRVEATFQDSKSRGWNIEASLVTDQARLDRLLLVLFLAMWWLRNDAASCIHHGQRHRFDRHDRRDKGIF